MEKMFVYIGIVGMGGSIFILDGFNNMRYVGVIVCEMLKKVVVD